jgi:hypothetical protein
VRAISIVRQDALIPKDSSDIAHGSAYNCDNSEFVIYTTYIDALEKQIEFTKLLEVWISLSVDGVLWRPGLVVGKNGRETRYLRYLELGRVKGGGWKG